MTASSAPKAQRVHVEVLPPETKGATALSSNSWPRMVALLMDNLFKIPGTKTRFGLNPLLDLVPGIGDATAAVISAVTLYVAAQNRVPKVVLARMGLNILLNSVIGIIPGVGEVFAFWFRPSQRNYELLQKHMARDDIHKTTAHDWMFVIGLIAAVMIVFASCVFAGAYLFVWIFHSLSSGG